MTVYCTYLSGAVIVTGPFLSQITPPARTYQETAPKDAMRKHHKKWNVVQSGHCTVVLLHLVAAAGRQHHGTVTYPNCGAITYL